MQSQAGGNETRADALAAIRSVLAATCACEERDFLRDGVIFTPARDMPGRLRSPIQEVLIVTLGDGVVVSCNPAREEWLRANLSHLSRDRVFSATTIAHLARHLEWNGGLSLHGPGLKYACAAETFRPVAVPPETEIAVVTGDDILDLYRYPGFDDALSYDPDSHVRDVLAAVATRDGTIVGIAGASADSERLWQVGVNVVLTARRRGVGRAVVSRLTEEILALGKVPFYATAVSNLRSRAIALALGYWPAWTDLYSRPPQE